MFQRRPSLRFPTAAASVAFASLLAAAPSAQGFVERAAEVGLVHEVATGFDRVGVTQLFDWAVGSKSVLQKMQPSQSQAAGPHQLKAMLQPRDASGWRLGPFADVEMVAIPDAGSAPVTVRSDLHPLGLRNGEHMIVMEKPLTDPPTPASGVLQFFVDGAMIGQVTYDY